MNIVRCATCGLEKTEWPNRGAEPCMKDGLQHCCAGCAYGTGCTCYQDVPADDIGIQERKLTGIALETREQMLDIENGAAIDSEDTFPADKELKVRKPRRKKSPG